MMPLLTASLGAAAAHPLDATIARAVWLLPVLPLIGALINGAVALTAPQGAGTARSRLVTLVGPGSILTSFALALGLFSAMLHAGAQALHVPYVRTVGDWIPAGTLQLSWSFQLDQLSMLMTLVITGVGTLIHVYSVGYMREDPGYARYFAYLNLFVACMLVLVLGASYPVLFIGWEGVGLCSYLLIGFWFTEPANVRAGTKAFVVNRIGDAGFLVAMFLMWGTAHALDFVSVHQVLATQAGTPVVLAIALLLFLGCTGKSAQIPLYIWLPDAMAGPTPVSALIHAATMVTAGVYLVARACAIFAGAPSVSLLVTLVGAVTATFAATVALRQWDIKKVLAYSTVSQLGYMFMAVGAGAYAAGAFHLVTHAFFKAVLFLGAGSVIHAMHAAYHRTHRHADPQDMRNMGGLRRLMPVTASLMLLATLAIAGIPPFAGFFSKDEILASVFAQAQGSPLSQASLVGVPGHTVLFLAYGLGVVTALLTAIYMARLILLTFWGENRTGAEERASLHDVPAVMLVPVAVLAGLSVIGGWLNLPAMIPMGPTGVLEAWLEPVTGASAERLRGGAALSPGTEHVLLGIALVTALLGLLIAVLRYRAPLSDAEHAAPEAGLRSIVANAYGVDAMLDRAVVHPVQWTARQLLARGVDRGVDSVWTGVGRIVLRTATTVGQRLQDGDVSHYAWVIAIGALAILGVLSLR